MLILVLSLIIIFLINIITYWLIIFKRKLIYPKFFEIYKKAFPFIWITCIYVIPIINSSFFQLYFNENISYFHQYWVWFILIGIIIIILGLKIYSLAKKSLKIGNEEREELKLIRKGVYEMVRHPQYLSWILIYLGITFIFDSSLAIVWAPFLIIITERFCLLEEKYIISPRFGDDYKAYKKKTPYKLISPPYNYIFIIMGIIVAYIGFLNFFNI